MASPSRSPWLLGAVLALALALALPAPAAATLAAGDPRALPTGGDLGAPFLVSDLTDRQEDSHLVALFDGSVILAAWETDNANSNLTPDQERLEFGEASFLVNGQWTNPFPVSVVNGTVSEGHFMRGAAAPHHFLLAYLLPATRGFGVAVVPEGAVFPDTNYVFEPPTTGFYNKQSAASAGGVDFAGAIATDTEFGPPGGQAVVVYPLSNSTPEVAWSAGNLTVRDALLVDDSGQLAALVEYAADANSPSQIGLLVRGQGGGWGPLIPLTPGEGDRFHRQVYAMSDRGRLLVTFERQTSPEVQTSEIAYLELAPNGTVTRSLTVSPASSGSSHMAPSIAVFGGRAMVAWETNDDGLSPGGALATFYRTVDGTDMGPILPVSPPGDAGPNGPARLVSDGPRLFGLWITSSPALQQGGTDTDIVGRYLGGDFDGDGLLDVVDPTPAGPPPVGTGGAGDEAAEAPVTPVPVLYLVGAGVAGAVGGLALGLYTGRAGEQARAKPGSRPGSRPR